MLVVDDSEQHEDAFSITHPERNEWLAFNESRTQFRWTQRHADRIIFHRAIKLADNEGQVGELKAGEVALYQHVAYTGKVWVFSDNGRNNGGNFKSLSSFAGLNNQISSIRVGPNTGVTLFANNNQVVNEAQREQEIEDFVDNVPTMFETQIGNDNISSLKIFRTAASETIFNSVTSKMSQDYRLVNDELEEFSAYRTVLRLAPEVKEIEVSATDLTTIEVEDVVHEIDEIRSVTLRPNLMNQIMITSEADDISTPGLKFRTTDMAENQFVVIFPDRDVHQRIAELEDGALWNARDAKGNLIVDQSKHTRGEIASVQNTIKRTMASVITIDDSTEPDSTVGAINGLNRVVSTKQDISAEAVGDPWTLNFQAPPAATIPAGSAGLVQAHPNIWEEPVNQNSFELLLANARSATPTPDTSPIPSSPNNDGVTLDGNLVGLELNFVSALRIGRRFRRIRDAVKSAVRVTIGVAKNVAGAIKSAVTAIIDLGDEIVSFVLDTAAKVADFVAGVVEKVIESVKQFVEFLRFLFDWKDILETQRFLVRTINSAFDSAADMVAAAKEPVSNFISDAQEALDDGIDSLISSLGVDPDEIKEDSGFELPEAAEWFLNKLLGGSKRSDSKTDPDASQTNASAGDAFQQALQSLLAAMVDVVEIGGTVFDGIFDTIETLIANPRRPELALAEILDTFRDVGIKALSLGENIIHAFLDLVVTAIRLLRDVFNLEIRIPLISKLFEMLGAGKLTILNVATVLVAIPVTVISKLLFGEAPFQDVEPEFPRQTIVSGQQDLLVSSDAGLAFPQQVVVAGSPVALVQAEPRIDIDSTRRKIRGFGTVAIVSDLIGGLISTTLDLTPEEFDDNGERTAFFERLTLVLSGFSWLASFPASPFEPGGYPYNLLLDKNRVSKSQHEQEYWERVMWGWRTGMLGLDIVYAIAGAFDLVPKQRFKRGDDVTAGLTTMISLVDVGLTGRFLATIPKDDGRGREVANEILGRLPSVFAFLRNDRNDSTQFASISALFILNIVATVSTTAFGIQFLQDDVAALDEL